MPNTLLSIGEAATLLGVSIDTLRRWDKANRLQSVRSGPRGHRYFRRLDIDLFVRNTEAAARQWAAAPRGTMPSPEVYCHTRDEFQARLENLQSMLTRRFPISTVSLVSAVAGEIGNNSFDHNLGNWPDITGIFFSYDTKNNTIVLADRGQGILATLKRVRPELTSAREALKVAFTQIISGRPAEARGNGLKFVRSVIVDNPLTLCFQTGDAYLFLHHHDADVVVAQAQSIVRGCFAIIGCEGAV